MRVIDHVEVGPARPDHVDAVAVDEPEVGDDGNGQGDDPENVVQLCPRPDGWSPVGHGRRIPGFTCRPFRPLDDHALRGGHRASPGATGCRSTSAPSPPPSPTSTCPAFRAHTLSWRSGPSSNPTGPLGAGWAPGSSSAWSRRPPVVHGAGRLHRCPAGRVRPGGCRFRLLPFHPRDRRMCAERPSASVALVPLGDPPARPRRPTWGGISTAVRIAGSGTGSRRTVRRGSPPPTRSGLRPDLAIPRGSAADLTDSSRGPERARWSPPVPRRRARGRSPTDRERCVR